MLMEPKTCMFCDPCGKWGYHPTLPAHRVCVEGRGAVVVGGTEGWGDWRFCCLFSVELVSVLFNPSAPQSCLLAYLFPLFHIPRKQVEEKGDGESSSLPSKWNEISESSPTYRVSAFPRPVIKTNLVRGPLPQISPPPQAEHRLSSHKSLDLNLGSVIFYSCVEPQGRCLTFLSLSVPAGKMEIIVTNVTDSRQRFIVRLYKQCCAWHFVRAQKLLLMFWR